MIHKDKVSITIEEIIAWLNTLSALVATFACFQFISNIKK